MSRYRRATTAGATYFFTVVAYRRQTIFCDEVFRNALRAAITAVRVTHPFVIDAWVLLPDHLHCVWTLPDGDADFTTRWKLIKRAVSVACREDYRSAELMTASKIKHRESTIWQRRFWEHQIRDDLDLQRHADYIHFNPVKHGHVKRAVDWPHSTFHRNVQQGIYLPEWPGSSDDVKLDAGELM
jgi:putative transposase